MRAELRGAARAQGRWDQTGLTRGHFECLEDSQLSLEVQFNPTSFRLGRTVNWVEQPAHGQQYTTLQFSHGGSDTLGMTLLLDTTENEASILPMVQKTYAWTSPMEIRDDVSRPPCVVFQWELFRFQGVVRGLDIEFLLFDPTGKPKRAQIKLDMLGQAFMQGKSPGNFFGQSTRPKKVGRASVSGQVDARLGANVKW